jgi:Anti-sigma-K factor rskA
MRDHEMIEGLLAARELGGLESDGEVELRSEMRSHGDCAECRRLERETAEAVAGIAFLLPPVEPSPGLEERTVARALAARPATRPADRPLAVAPGPVRARGRRTWARAVVAAAAAMAIFAGGWLTGSLTGRGSAFSLAQGRVAAFQGSGAGSLALVYRPSGRGMYLVGSGLAPAEAGRTYELWLFHGSTPVRAGCFEPSGGGAVLMFLDVPLASAGQAAVTREPSSCPSAPTTQPIFTTAL